MFLIAIRQVPVLVALLLAVLSGCSAKQGFEALQDNQSQRCRTIADHGERERCHEETNGSYEEYISNDVFKYNY